jgi:hypothetical protein
VPVGEVDDVYRDDELPCRFNINPDLTLNSLVGNANDVTLPKKKETNSYKDKET